MTRSGLRLVKLFLGGQTVTLGNTRSVMGRVSMVVETGLSAQLEKDCWIKTAAMVKPVMTTHSQARRTSRLLVEMYTSPWMEEESRNSFKPSIVAVEVAMKVITRYLLLTGCHVIVYN